MKEKQWKDRWINKDINIIDWFMFGLLALVGYLFFSHTDIVVTAQNSLQYLNGNLLDFYSQCKETSGTYGANYLPSTFIIFALWNLPLKLFSLVPESWNTWNTLFLMWNKILPSVIYMMSGYMIYRICLNEFNMDNVKSKIAAYTFLTAPIGFYSQFIFCQYDIFTVFFMLLGIKYYFRIETNKRNGYLFITFFAIASTFKYHALLIFVVLLVLKEKDILKIVITFVCSLTLLIISGGFYFIFDREGFKNSVLGFNALNYATSQGISVGFGTLNLLLIVFCVIVAFAYFTKATDKEQWIRYSFYYCSGVCFVLFGFMKWHPQWLLFAVPFWTISFVTHDKFHVFLWIDMLAAVIFNVFVVNYWPDSLDQNLFKGGILYADLQQKASAAKTMADIYIYQDIDMMFSLLFAVFLVYFIFTHPRFSIKSIGYKLSGYKGILRARFLIGVLSFMIPAFACLPSLYSSSDVFWANVSMTQAKPMGRMSDVGVVTQQVMMDGGTLEKVTIPVGTYSQILSDTKIYLNIYDTTNGMLVASSESTVDIINDMDTVEFVFNNDWFEADRIYEFQFSVESGEGEEISLFYNVYEGNHHKGLGDSLNRRIVMAIYGDITEVE